MLVLALLMWYILILLILINYLLLHDLCQVVDGQVAFVPILFQPFVDFHVDLVDILSIAFVFLKHLVLRLHQRSDLHQTS